MRTRGEYPENQDDSRGSSLQAKGITEVLRRKYYHVVLWEHRPRNNLEKDVGERERSGGRETQSRHGPSPW